MTTNDVHLGLLTAARLHDKKLGRELLTTLAESPLFAPERYGNWEPLTNVFRPENVDEALGSWRDPFLWSRRSPSSSGSVWMPPQGTPQHGAISINAESLVAEISTLTGLLRQLATMAHADFGYLHVLSPPEVDSGMAAGVVSALDKKRTRFDLSVTTHDLRKWIPDLYWATVLGAPYIELFGRERVLATPAAVVEEVGEDLIYLQLTRDLNDVNNDASRFSEARRAAKVHLGAECFFTPDVTNADKRTRVPRFAFDS